MIFMNSLFITYQQRREGEALADWKRQKRKVKVVADWWRKEERG